MNTTNQNDQIQRQQSAALARNGYPQTDIAGTSTMSKLPAWKQNFVQMRDNLIAEYRAHHLSLEEIGATLKEMGVSLHGITVTTKATRTRTRGVVKASARSTRAAGARRVLGKTETRVFTWIKAHPNGTSGDIRKGARIATGSQVGGLLTKLVDKGFVQRFGERGSYTYSAV